MNYNEIGHVCPRTNRRCIEVSLFFAEYCDEENGYTYDPEMAACGLEPWRRIDGVDAHVRGTSFDIWYADGGYKRDRSPTYPVYVK